MKNDVMPSIVQMEPEVLRNLVKEVKETVAKNIHLPKTSRPSFGIVDLWNIRRNARSAISRFRG
jgi:hypothetical protein